MMPFADTFAPDVNFVSARSVYPTMGGATVAGAGAGMSPATNTTTVDPSTGQAAPVSSAVGASGALPSSKGKSAFWWLGLLALLVVMVVIARKAGGEEDFRNIRPTAYNFLTITLTSIVGIVALKTLAVKYRIPGASDVILAA